MHMKVETKLTKVWRRKMLFLIAMVFAGSLWFLFDGFYGYPKKAERYEVFRQIAGSDSPDARADQDVRRAWEKIAAERRWPPDLPKEITAKDIRDQKLYGAGTAVVGVLLVFWLMYNDRLSIRADDTNVYSARGKKVPFGEIIGLDKAKWDSKGIAYAIYVEEGRQKKLVLDDYKFEGTEKIVEDIERRLAQHDKERDEPKA
jgi:hypothetical protein